MPADAIIPEERWELHDEYWYLLCTSETIKRSLQHEINTHP
jgi:hypothetical protein